MEAMGAMCYSLDDMFSDETEFMSQLIANTSNSINNSATTFSVDAAGSSSSTLWQLETGFMYGDFPFPADHDHVMTSMDHDHVHDHVMTSMDHDHVHDHDHHVMIMSEESMCHELDEAPIRVECKKKRPRIHGDIPVPRNRRGGVKLSKRPKVDDMMNSSSSFCSEDTNSSCSGAAAKTRAGRGSATDPQSLYARKRRERINERLKVLQKLVPNGTKVDISTMLEEAVQYVKFLQLQIKLLSSDDMWMYAPIAYNGMDLGALHSKISQS